jgi:hypothetical protein
MRDVLARLLQTKMLLSCVLLVVAGVVLMVIGNHLDHGTAWAWLKPLPWNEFGGILIGAGLLSVWLDHFFAHEQDAMDELRLRRLLSEQAPAMRDAVLEAFAANKEDLARVATPETLDQIITNSLALRLHDPQFAGEIYADIREQAVGATERWHDASLSIKLAPGPERRGAHTPRGGGPAYFMVTVRWEYTVIPHNPQRRFVVLSDRQEYAEVASERGATSAWYIKPEGGIDVSTREAFELLQFTVDGEARSIRRATRKTGQIYAANIGEDHLEANEAVTIAGQWQ